MLTGLRNKRNWITSTRSVCLMVWNLSSRLKSLWFIKIYQDKVSCLITSHIFDNIN